MDLGKLLLTRQHEPEAVKALKEGRVSFIDKRYLVGGWEGGGGLVTKR